MVSGAYKLERELHHEPLMKTEAGVYVHFAISVDVILRVMYLVPNQASVLLRGGTSVAKCFPD